MQKETHIKGKLCEKSIAHEMITKEKEKPVKYTGNDHDQTQRKQILTSSFSAENVNCKSSTTSNSEKDDNITVSCFSSENPHNSTETCDRDSQLDTSKYSVFILGDSVTKVLRTDKMTTDKTNVKIKSQGGANLKDIHSKMSSLIANQPHVQNTDVFVIHAGINNILRGDQPEEVKQQLLELTELLRQINPHIKIIVSSILPMKADKTYQEKITNTNELLRTLCNEKSITFIDNTDSFMKNQQQTNQSLYVNEVHLNNHGAAVFAKQIKSTIRQLLKIEPRKTQGNFRQAGRSYRTPLNQHHKRQNNPWRFPHFHHPPGAWNLPPWMYTFPPLQR
jgi:lysophospholipase L1-like esterase